MFGGLFPDSVANPCEKCGRPTSQLGVDEGTGFHAFDNIRNFFNLVNFVNHDGFGSQCIENIRSNRVECDLSQFVGIRPENIIIDVKGRNVSVRAQQEDKSADGDQTSTHMVQSTFSLPASADMSKLSAYYAPNSHLIIRAPMEAPPAISDDKPGVVPIQINRQTDS